jgi:uncharacterized protein
MKTHWTRRHLLKAASAAGFIGALYAYRHPITHAAHHSMLGSPDEHGVRVLPGFQVRLLATSGELVNGTDYRWHLAPDGGATFALPNGGWVYVSNSEVEDHKGGASALRFTKSGEISAAYSLLQGTNRNCAGGLTPWGTWLSCEETPDGLVYECIPTHAGQGVARPALGRFMHEAAAVDVATGFVYLTEDEEDSRFYRFRPAARRDLSRGTLEAARVASDGTVSWVAVTADAGYRGADTTPFRRGEGIWFYRGTVYFTTTSDHRVWAYSPAIEKLGVLYDGTKQAPGNVLRDPDNLTVHPRGSLYVAEDTGDLQLVCLRRKHGRWDAIPAVQFVGHDASEVAGPAFSPDGTRLYVSSQRGRDGNTGMTFEITGPFNGF